MYSMPTPKQIARNRAKACLAQAKLYRASARQYKHCQYTGASYARAALAWLHKAVAYRAQYLAMV